jgi:negative regulator of sigma E activity
LDPPVEYEARLRVWNPGVGQVEVGLLRWDGMVRYTVETPSGPAHTAVGLGRKARYGGMPPGSGPARTVQAFAQPIAEDIDLLVANYTITREAGPSIAGCDTVVLTISPKRVGNVRRVVWVDEVTGVQLKVEDYNYRGDVVQRREVVSISYAPVLRPETKASAEAALAGAGAVPHPMSRHTVQEASKELRFNLVVPTWIPEGYHLVDTRTPRPPMGDMGPDVRVNMAHLVFHDGLGVISLYESPVPWWARRSRPPVAGPVIEWEHAGTRFVLVGDVDPQWLVRMAQSTMN